jgi:phosphatidylinositol glycan class A protein
LHETVKSCYSWTKVASRTENIYKYILRKPTRNLVERFITYNGTGIISGKISVLIIAMVQIMMYILDYFFPASRIAKALKL